MNRGMVRPPPAAPSAVACGADAHCIFCMSAVSDEGAPPAPASPLPPSCAGERAVTGAQCSSAPLTRRMRTSHIGALPPYEATAPLLAPPAFDRWTAPPPAALPLVSASRAAPAAPSAAAPRPMVATRVSIVATRVIARAPKSIPTIAPRSLSSSSTSASATSPSSASPAVPSPSPSPSPSRCSPAGGGAPVAPPMERRSRSIPVAMRLLRFGAAARPARAFAARARRTAGKVARFGLPKLPCSPPSPPPVPPSALVWSTDPARGSICARFSLPPVAE